MIPLQTVVLMLTLIFALIGSLRGWAKEVIVAFTVILALFVEQVLTGLIPPIRDVWLNLPPLSRFWIRVIFFNLLVIFGYATPTLSQRFGAKIARERLQDILLGFFLGLLNGFLIIGTVWFYLDEAYYGVPEDLRRQEQATVQSIGPDGNPLFDEAGNPIMEPLFDEAGNPVFETVYADGAVGLADIRPPVLNSPARNLLPYLPPRIINGPPLYLAVGLAFIFVIIVFI
jgi:uncharacterized membrane protein required for colicin V production